MDKSADLLPDVQLQEHQQRIYGESKEAPIRKLLMYSLGSGKSLSAIAGAEARGEPYTAVVPAALRPNFRKEIDKFTDKSTPHTVMSYTEAAKGKPTEHLGTLILDEVQRLRNPGSKQTQQVTNLANQARQVIALSGTPIVNQPSDIAPLVSLLRNKPISPEEFTQRYVQEKEVKPSLFNRLRGVTPGIERSVQNEDELKALLQGHVDFYAPSKPTVPTSREEHVSEMNTDQVRLYKAMLGRLPWMLRWKLQHEFPLSTEELQRMIGFLTGPRQLGLSVYPFMRKQDPYKAFQQSPKLQQAHQLLQEKLKDQRTKALIFSNFVDAGLKPYQAALERSGVPAAMFHGGLSDVQRKQLVDDYNKGKLRVAMLGPSGAEGLSFKGTQLVQLLDPYWHNVRTKQQEGRGIRFDSHTELPPELQNVTIQQFIARLPMGLKDRLMSNIGFNREQSTHAADDALKLLASKKDRLNQQFLDLLKEVGSNRTRPAEHIRRSNEPVQQSTSLAAQETGPEAQLEEHRNGVLARLWSMLFGQKQASEIDSEEETDSPTKLLPWTAAGVTGVLAAIAAHKAVASTTDKAERRKKQYAKYSAVTQIPGFRPTSPQPAPTIDVPEETIPPIKPEVLDQAPNKGGILQQLHQAKKYSDAKQWVMKHKIIRDLMEKHPYQWEVEQMPGYVLGVRHWPTGYRFHMPKSAVPQLVFQEVQARKHPPLELD